MKAMGRKLNTATQNRFLIFAGAKHSHGWVAPYPALGPVCGSVCVLHDRRPVSTRARHTAMPSVSAADAMQNGDAYRQVYERY